MTDTNQHLEAIETPVYLGIDVGGTDVKIGLVDHRARLIDHHRTPTPELGSPENVFTYAIQHARKRLAHLGITQSEMKGVGLAVPGVLDTSKFVLREVVNLPGWLGVPLQEKLQAESNLPSSVINDANSAALAEHGLRNMKSGSLALVTLGTGIGCGVVVGGQPHGGDHGCAGELGHITVDFSPDALPCSCGSRGHLESYAGAAGVVARLRIEMKDPSVTLPDQLKDAGLTPLTITEAAAKGNRTCMKVIVDTGMYLGRAIGMIGQVIDPDVVLLGGAMNFGGEGTITGDAFIKSVRDNVKATTLVQVGGNIKIEFANLGNTAGMLGAAMLAKMQAD